MTDTPKLNFLVAYPYLALKSTRRGVTNLEMIKTWPKDAYRLIVDSGAFTAWNSGQPIQLDDYCRFLDTLDHLRPFHAVQLDVVGDGEASWRNYQTMRRRGYEVMPVFTRGETPDRLEAMFETTDYALIGGIVAKEKNRNYLKWFMELPALRKPGRKVHWLGFTNLDFVKVYRPESVDSSSWCRGGMFGGVDVYMGRGVMRSMVKEAFKRPPAPDVQRALAALGFQPDQWHHLSKDVVWSKPWYFAGTDWTHAQAGMANFISTVSHVRRSIDLERRFGTKLYLSGNNEHINGTLWDAYTYLREHRCL